MKKGEEGMKKGEEGKKEGVKEDQRLVWMRWRVGEWGEKRRGEEWIGENVCGIILAVNIVADRMHIKAHYVNIWYLKLCTLLYMQAWPTVHSVNGEFRTCNEWLPGMTTVLYCTVLCCTVLYCTHSFSLLSNLFFLFDNVCVCYLCQLLLSFS